MSLYKDASLVMIPSAYKDGKLYSIRPTDGSGDFTFSRGSNLAATRVDVNGLIEKGRENLLTYSNDFSQGVWNKDSGASVSSGEVGYDGSNDAWRLTKPSLVGSRIRYTSSITGVHTGSIYVKAGSLEYLKAESFSGSAVCYDLVNGTIVFEGGIGLVGSTIQSAGNGWWRISLTNKDNALYFMLYPADSSAITGGTGSTAGYIYIQDAQLEAGLVATDYIETGASTAQAGILEDMPRLDYSGGASCPALLLEPQRSNLSAYSEYFNGGIWIQSASVVTDNDAASLEGKQNAAKLAGDGTNTQIRLYDNYTFPSTGNYTISVFAKAGNNDYIALAFKGVDGGSTAYYNLADGTTNFANATIEAVGSDGWYRCSLTADLTGPDLTGNYNIYVARDETTTTFPSNGDANGKYVHIYGYQLESGSYPTSYIPTYGASVTRSKDNAGTIDVSSLGVSTGYTLFYELGEFDLTATTWVIQRNASNTALYESYGTTAIIRTASGVVYPFNHGTTGTQIKVAVNYDGTNINVFTDGIKRGSWVASSDWSSFGVFEMDYNAVRANWKQVAIFPTALTDSECIALTTL